MRERVQLGRPEDAIRIKAALKRPVAKAWQRQRLQAMQMVAQGKWTLQQIGDAVGAGRSTVAGWLKLLRAEGFEALLRWKEGQGAPGKVPVEIQAAIQAGLAAGRWRLARDLLRWLQQEHGIEMGLGGAYYYLGKAGGVLKVPRRTHAKKDAAKAELFKADLAGRLHALPLEAGRPIRVWVADRASLWAHARAAPLLGFARGAGEGTLPNQIRMGLSPLGVGGRRPARRAGAL